MVACWLTSEGGGEMQALIKVNQLTKEFVLGNILSREKILAVDQVSFEIKPAEIFTLAGESGVENYSSQNAAGF